MTALEQLQMNLLRLALEAYMKRYPYGDSEEKPKTGACHHNEDTCMACEGLVSSWRIRQQAEAALTASASHYTYK